MARCYEFGVAVGEGCEHAMVVVAEGGACECHTCGVRCLGKFAGCAAVIAQPGYVPSTAPSWAVATGPIPDPLQPAGVALSDELALAPDVTILPEVTEGMGVAQALLVAVQAELDSMRALLHALLDRPASAGREEILDAVQRIRHELDERDADLLRAFDRVHARLTAIEEDMV